MDYTKHLKFYKDFPLHDVNFVDIIPFLQDKELFGCLIDDLGKLCQSPNIAAPEARGFLFAAPLMITSPKVKNIILLRKKGKLPFNDGDLIGIDIEKEYGKDQIYFRLSDVAAGVRKGDVIEVTFFDDILATGGTALGIARGMQAQKVVVDGVPCSIKITDFVFLVELDVLKGRKLLEGIAPVKALIHL